MEEPSKRRAEEATDSVVDVATAAGQAVTCPAQGDGDEQHSNGAEPQATIRAPPPSCDYAAVFLCGTFDRRRASISSVSLPSAAGQQAAHSPFHLLPSDSEHFIRWDPPTTQDTSPDGGSPFGVEERGATLVVLLGWLGAPQRHLRRYADMYRDRGFGSLRFVVPVRKVVGTQFGRRIERRVADLSAMIAAWCDADRRRTLLFHTFSHTGWLTYGQVLENLQSRSDIIERIRGCIIDSAPVREIRPQGLAAGFSAAILKKNSSFATPSADSPDASNKVNPVSELERPSLGEAFLLSTLRKFFEILLHGRYVKQRLCKLHVVLWEKQPSCPQLYLYSSADRLVPAEEVESFISTQRSLGLRVSAHNFVSSPHVDHYRSFPHLYPAKVDEFLKICSPARVRCDGYSFLINEAVKRYQ